MAFQSLLMGGQACVFYRAAQVRKDLDRTRLTEPANLERLRVALKQLAAQRIAVQEPRHNKTSPIRQSAVGGLENRLGFKCSSFKTSASV